MRDAIKTLYEHWINVHTTSSAEKLAFEAINKAAKGQAEHDPLYTAIVEYSEVIQYEAFKEGVLTALSLLLILSRLVDTFSSRILYPMLLLSGNHSIAVV